LAEGFHAWRQARAERSYGVFGQAALTLVPNRAQLAFRVSSLDPSVATQGDSVLTLETLLALYAFGNRAKLQLRYELSEGEGAATLRPPGWAHSMVAQVQFQL
jgi:hypothetical protein